MELKGSIEKRQHEKDSNPCYKEQALSFKCLSDNKYDQSKCYLFFENYKACKTFWNEIRIERMRKGVEPYVPKEAERQLILEERDPKKKTLK